MQPIILLVWLVVLFIMFYFITYGLGVTIGVLIGIPVGLFKLFIKLLKAIVFIVTTIFKFFISVLLYPFKLLFG